METVRTADRVSVGKRAGFTASWSISPINIYCTTSQHAQLTASLTVAVVQILLTLHVDRLSEPLRSDFNHILRLFFLTRIQYRYQARNSVQAAFLWKVINLAASIRSSAACVCVFAFSQLQRAAFVAFLTIMPNDFAIAVITRHRFDRLHFNMPSDPRI